MGTTKFSTNVHCEIQKGANCDFLLLAWTSRHRPRLYSSVERVVIISDQTTLKNPRNLKDHKSLTTNPVPSVFPDAPTATDEQVITFGRLL